MLEALLWILGYVVFASACFGLGYAEGYHGAIEDATEALRRCLECHRRRIGDGKAGE